MALTTNTNHDTLTQRLADSGLRATPQREMVYEVLLEKRDHPTADEVFARAKSRMPAISLATVYNCLETLVGCGLVKQVNHERESTRYCPNLREHAHFHDLESGRVYDIDLPEGLVAQLKSMLPTGFDAANVELNFHGRSKEVRS